MYLSGSFLALLLAFCASTVQAHFGGHGNSRFNTVYCPGNETVVYNVTFYNYMSTRNFPNSGLPEGGLVFSPPSVATHSGRVSILTVRGYASPAIEAIAETGNNSLLVSDLIAVRDSEMGGVGSLAAGEGGIPAGSSLSLNVTADCSNNFFSSVAMIAPSPDWIVQFANINLLRMRKFRSFGSRPTQPFFYTRVSFLLRAYDAGTDSGANFTDPSDLSLDIPTEPKLNIAPLVEDETDRFGGRPVGRIVISRIM